AGGRVAVGRPGPGGEVEHPGVRLKRVVVPEDADAAAEHGRACTLHVPGEADPGRDEERRALDPRERHAGVELVVDDAGERGGGRGRGVAAEAERDDAEPGPDGP